MSTPSFIKYPRIGFADLSTANTATDGTGTITDLLVATNTAGRIGTRCLRIVTQGTNQTAAGLVNIFLNDGTNWRLRDQITIGAATGSTTVKGNQNFATYTDLFLPVGWKIGVTLTVAPVSGSVVVTAFGGDVEE